MAHNANAIAALLMVCSTSFSGTGSSSTNSSLVQYKADIIRTIDSNRSEMQAKELKLALAQDRIDSLQPTHE